MFLPFNKISLWLAAAGWGTAAATGWAYLQARDAIIEEREGCNVVQLEGALEAARDSLKRQSEAHKRWRERMAATIAEEHAARELMESVAADAIVRLDESQRLLEEAENAECLDSPADIALLDSLRD